MTDPGHNLNKTTRCSLLAAALVLAACATDDAGASDVAGGSDADRGGDSALDSPPSDGDTEGAGPGDTAPGDTSGEDVAGTDAPSDTSGDDSAPDATTDATPGPVPDGWLFTEGNGLFVAGGGRFHGRGANLPETRSCNACAYNAPDVGEVERRIDLLIDDWGANFVRLDLESYASSDGRVHWASPLSDGDYVDDIHAIVDYLGAKPSVYVLLALWVDPSHDAMGWPTESTIETWELLAEEFAEEGHVLYGLVNEPQSNFDGSLDGQVWQRMNDTVAAIRAVESDLGAPPHVITVQGTRAWARVLDYYVDHPITAGGGVNVAYETHVYNPSSDFEDLFERPSQTLPVVIGEFGPANMSLAECGEMMVRAEAVEVPYLAWTFHMRCPPNLLVDNSGGGCGIDMTLAPTDWGNLLRDRLAVAYGAGE